MKSKIIDCNMKNVFQKLTYISAVAWENTARYRQKSKVIISNNRRLYLRNGFLKERARKSLPRWYFFVDFFICVCLCYTALSVSCSLDVTPWKRAFTYDILGQVWYFIISIPDLCLLPFALFELMPYVPVNLAGTCTTCKQRIVCLAKNTTQCR